MSPRLNTCRLARRDLKDGENILSVQGWINFQRIDDVALIGVKSKSVKDDHLCYHSAQKQAVPILLIFTDLIEDIEDYVSLISFQINSISSFSKFLYKYFIK